jgi:hypothetical protein
MHSYNPSARTVRAIAAVKDQFQMGHLVAELPLRNGQAIGQRSSHRSRAQRDFKDCPQHSISEDKFYIPQIMTCVYAATVAALSRWMLLLPDNRPPGAV